MQLAYVSVLVSMLASAGICKQNRVLWQGGGGGGGGGAVNVFVPEERT